MEVIDTCVIEYLDLGVYLDYHIDLESLALSLSLIKGYPIEVQIKI